MYAKNLVLSNVTEHRDFVLGGEVQWFVSLYTTGNLRCEKSDPSESVAMLTLV